MALADFAAGVQGGLQELLLKRLAAQQYADQMKQQGFENQRQLGADARAQQQLNATLELARMQREAQAADLQDRRQQRTFGEANALADQIPAGAFMAETDPAVATMQAGGRGALLTPKAAGMGADFQGPLNTGETPQDVANGLPKGFLKTPSAKQQQVSDATAQAAQDKEWQRQVQLAQLRIQQQNANAAGQSKDLANEIGRLKLEAERSKLDKAKSDQETAATNARTTTETALGLIDRLERHPGFDMSYGNISSRLSGLSQNAVDAGSIRDQLVAALALPNLGALKGPMSDKDILFIKQISTRLGNPLISDGEARKALAEARVFLQNKIGAGPSTPTTGPVAMVAPDGRALMVPADKVAQMEAAGARRQ